MTIKICLPSWLRNLEYNRWLAMKSRCSNPKNALYKHYGARGIKVCKRWENSFDLFMKDMGVKPKNKSLDRINNDGNYSKKNCRWATAKQQARNSRPSIHLRQRIKACGFKAIIG